MAGKQLTLGVTVAICHGLVDNFDKLAPNEANALISAARNELMDHGYFIQRHQGSYKSDDWTLRRWNTKAMRPTRRHSRLKQGGFTECCKHALALINNSKRHAVVYAEEPASLPQL